MHAYPLSVNYFPGVFAVPKVFIYLATLSIAAEIERDLISKHTKDALRARKVKRFKLGRPKGPGKSKLDEFHEEIIALEKIGSTKSYVAKKYETPLPNPYSWLKKNMIDVKLNFSELTLSICALLNNL